MNFVMPTSTPSNSKIAAYEVCNENVYDKDDNDEAFGALVCAAYPVV